MFIGIPILNRVELLRACLESIDHAPCQKVIVNNNSISRIFRARLERLAQEHGAIVLHQHRNLGVAGSWNLLLRTAFEAGHQEVCIGSNDTILSKGALAAAAAYAKCDDVAVWHLQEWNFFILTKRTVERVGWFDENFYPAYKEDQDYAYRCQLAGLSRVNIPNTGAIHIGSATIRNNPAYARYNLTTHAMWNQSYYLKKWGADAGAEQFVHPFNQMDMDWHQWPDPTKRIEAGDWDAGWRRLAAATPKPDEVSDALYERYLTLVIFPSDINEHLPVIKRYASRCRRIVEFGTGRGISTIALLLAQPERLVCYDLAARNADIEFLEANAGRTNFTYLQQGSTVSDIEETDLLFIDTWHSYSQLRDELTRQANLVTRYIMFHATVSFGEKGQDESGGIMQAIREFLSAHKDWRLVEERRNNHGLMVIERVP